MFLKNEIHLDIETFFIKKLQRYVIVVLKNEKLLNLEFPILIY